MFKRIKHIYIYIYIHGPSILLNNSKRKKEKVHKDILKHFNEVRNGVDISSYEKHFDLDKVANSRPYSSEPFSLPHTDT